MHPPMTEPRCGWPFRLGTGINYCSLPLCHDGPCRLLAYDGTPLVEAPRFGDVGHRSTRTSIPNGGATP